MTINQYLCLLEALLIRRDNAFEKYMRLLESASAPAAARIDPDGLPKAKNYRNSHEDLLIRVADAGAAYNNAWDKYEKFYKQLEKNLETLANLYGWTERAALEVIYIENMGRPQETRRGGVCRRCNCCTKAEAAILIKQAKQHLTEILKEQGIEITMNRKVIEFKGPGGQELHRISPLQTFATGTINYIEARFDLSDTWAGYNERLAVWYNGSAEEETPIDESGVIVIPRKVLEQPGTLKMNLCFSCTENGTTAKRLTSRPVDVLKLVKANY